MRVISVNVGKPREVEWRGKMVSTGIYKEPVSGRVAVRSLNLDGDGQADLSVHGGLDKAVYAYPAEHYDYWLREQPGAPLGWGIFGENLTTDGLHEQNVCVGDRFRIGTAELVVTQPRLPCYKLGIRFQDPSIIGRFLASGRTGFYFAVTREGEVGEGDPVTRLSEDAQRVSIADFVRLYRGENDDPDLLRRVNAVEAVPESWRTWFAQHRS